ncbi:MAG: PIN domain-containing protein [Alkalispirochaeta sp.]
MRFLDTNILLYSISSVPGEQAKARIARELLDSADLALSTQVLQEFIVQATRRSRVERLEIEEALTLAETWTRYPVQEISAELVFRAGRSAERWQISYWDAAIIEAARQLGCRQVLSENLNAGQDFAGVIIIDPFEGCDS